MKKMPKIPKKQRVAFLKSVFTRVMKKKSCWNFIRDWQENSENLISKLLVTLTIVSHISSLSLSSSPDQIEANMSIKISSNIGFCVHQEFFSTQTREKIIISNHVPFLCEEILECFFCRDQEGGREGRRGRETSARAL